VTLTRFVVKKTNFSVLVSQGFGFFSVPLWPCGSLFLAVLNLRAG
jgi:hypothetical protein